MNGGGDGDGNTAAAKGSQQTKRVNVCVRTVLRALFSCSSLILSFSLCVFILDFSLPTSFSSGSLHDDRPVSIRSSKRSHWILHSSSLFPLKREANSTRYSSTHTHTQFKVGHSRCSPILQSTFNGIVVFFSVVCLHCVVE